MRVFSKEITYILILARSHNFTAGGLYNQQCIIVPVSEENKRAMVKERDTFFKTVYSIYSRALVLYFKKEGRTGIPTVG